MKDLSKNEIKDMNVMKFLSYFKLINYFETYDNLNEDVMIPIFTDINRTKQENSLLFKVSQLLARLGNNGYDTCIYLIGNTDIDDIFKIVNKYSRVFANSAYVSYLDKYNHMHLIKSHTLFNYDKNIEELIYR